jgi:hypothetical protein
VTPLANPSAAPVTLMATAPLKAQAANAPRKGVYFIMSSHALFQSVSWYWFVFQNFLTVSMTLLYTRGHQAKKKPRSIISEYRPFWKCDQDKKFHHTETS